MLSNAYILGLQGCKFAIHECMQADLFAFIKAGLNFFAVAKTFHSLEAMTGLGGDQIVM